MKGKNSEYQEKLDHLRFFAAFVIIMYHAVWMYQIVAKPLGVSGGAPPHGWDLIFNGHTSVALFMTLSGFLFATICKDKDIDQWSFYRNRFLRIYPLFMVVLMVSCTIDPQRNGFLNLMTSLFFLQNLKQSAVYLENCTDSLWAIAVEFQFYLLFPFLLLFFRKYGYKYLFGVIALAFLTRLAIYCTSGNAWELGYTTIFGRIDQFVIGMIFGFSFDRIKPRLAHPLLLLIAIALVLGLAQLMTALAVYGEGQWVFTTDLEAPVWGFLIACYSASRFNFPKALARVFAYGGMLSFSLYLIHPFMLRLAYWFVPMICLPHSRFPLLVNLAHTLHDKPFLSGAIFALFVVFPVTMFAASLTYPLIEKPFLEFRTTYGRPRRDEKDVSTTASGESETSRRGRAHLASLATARVPGERV